MKIFDVPSAITSSTSAFHRPKVTYSSRIIVKNLGSNLSRDSMYGRLFGLSRF